MNWVDYMQMINNRINYLGLSMSTYPHGDTGNKYVISKVNSQETVTVCYTKKTLEKRIKELSDKLR